MVYVVRRRPIIVAGGYHPYGYYYGPRVYHGYGYGWYYGGGAIGAILLIVVIVLCCVFFCRSRGANYYDTGYYGGVGVGGPVIIDTGPDIIYTPVVGGYGYGYHDDVVII